ncbi:MAG: NAD(P)H-dependent oxidoreductase [Pseudomonadota bacterium]
MSETLLVTASARGAEATSRDLAERLTVRLGGTVTHRDVAGGLPVVDADFMSGGGGETTTLSAALIAELKAHDTLIVATPMYNFGVPATLKAWIDLVARAGETFRYTEAGPVGLLEGKTAYVIVTTGGTPAEGDWDFTTPYLRHVLGFLGITDVHVIAADGMVVDAEAARAKAAAEIARIAA